MNAQFVLELGWIQQIRIYKTHTKFFLVGSNKNETVFKVLKIDREQSYDLVIEQSDTEYNLNEISEIITTLHAGNSGKSSSKLFQRGLVQSLIAYGLLGFVKFVEGYYMILITKRSKVAELGGYNIYKIEDTSMLYIPNSQVRVSKPEESKYLKSFQTVDLSSNFYFSYGYDLSNTLQHTISLKNWTALLKQPESNTDFDKVSCTSTSTVESWNEVSTDEISSDRFYVKTKKKHQRVIKIEPCFKYVWNKFLLQSCTDQGISHEWFVNIIHGYLKQIHVDVCGKPIYITLIARRSNLYAGTRFLKRGCNVNGDVANEVETEQIVHCGNVTSFEHGQYTAYVQHRGSIPVHWFQDITANVVPAKPPIHLAMPSPYAQAASKHFNSLLKRFGSPIVVLNLLRKRENKLHESILGNEFKSVVDYLNLFLSTDNQIVYLPIDMAHLARSQKADVLEKLDKVSRDVLYKTGFFQTKANLFSTTLNENKLWQNIGGQLINDFRIQTGVLRTNCADCLDRTNSAQFISAKCVLGFQLYALGIIASPKVEFDTPAIRMFEQIFEEHGDIIALQYGGSQLVHTIQSYRKTEVAIAAHSRDIVTTLSRYYSNTFSDSYKQNAINLFLGIFQPMHQPEHLWDTITDIYLHNDISSILRSFDTKSYRLWCDPVVQMCLPIPFDFVRSAQICLNEKMKHKDTTNLLENNDWFNECYDCGTLTLYDELFFINMQSSSSLQDISSDVSPFEVIGASKSTKQYTNFSSTLSSQSSGDESSSSNYADEEESSCDELHKSLSMKFSNLSMIKSETQGVSFDSCYGSLSEYELPKHDEKVLDTYLNVERILDNFEPLSVFTKDDAFELNPPVVYKNSDSKYVASIKCYTEYPKQLLSDVEDYKSYAALPH